MNIEAKEGTTFSIEGKAVKNDGAVYDLTGFTLESLISGNGRERLLTVGDGIEILDAVNGIYRLDISLNGFTPSAYSMDIKYSNGTVVDFSETHTIKVTKAITK